MNSGTNQWKRKLFPEEIEYGLRQFHGTEFWHRYLPGILLTDGALWLAEQAGAFWLLDAIWSHQPSLKTAGFQVWKLERQGTGALLTAEDGNYNRLLTQAIEYTDFPLAQIELFAAQENGELIILLPGEY